MYWVWLIALGIAIIVVIVLLNRFYRKASREVALIRTGLGGQKIIIPKSCNCTFRLYFSCFLTGIVLNKF